MTSPSQVPQPRASPSHGILSSPSPVIPAVFGSTTKPAAHVCEWVESVDGRMEESSRVGGCSSVGLTGCASTVDKKYSQRDVDDAIDRILTHVPTDVLTFDHSGTGVTTTYRANPIPDIPDTVVSPVDDVRPPVEPFYPSRVRTTGPPPKPRARWRSFHCPEKVGDMASSHSPASVLRNEGYQTQKKHCNVMKFTAKPPGQTQEDKKEERWATRRKFL
ncbi:uncharacterized protein [Diadema setosum]|uniref:uncharacterized protein n=1 Tax=Diadema setosum TaxID=31175 RepID=UPI003B3A05CF